MAALAAFAERGYADTSIRDIAARAGVDSALLYHYFGSKRRLFRAAVRLRMEPPRLPAEALRRETPRQLAERLIRLFFERWGDGEATPLLALLRSATSDPEAARELRDVLEKVLVPHVEARLGRENARLRVGLVASQLLGLSLVRHVVGLPPLSECSADELVRVGAPGVVAALGVGGTGS